MSDTLLKVDSLNAWYGRAQVLFDLGLEVGRGEVVALRCPAEEAAVVVDLDSRRTPHYRLHSQARSPEHAASGRGLCFPDSSGLPDRWHELQQTAMLGRPDPLLEEARPARRSGAHAGGGGAAGADAPRARSGAG